MNDIDLKYSKAFSEVVYTINCLTDELRKLIPKSFITFLEINSDKSYIVSSELLKKNGMMPETEVILAVIYMDFLCDEDEKRECINKDNEELEKLNKKYSDIFKNDKKYEIPKDKQIIDLNKEPVLKKIFIKIKKFFNKFI